MLKKGGEAMATIRSSIELYNSMTPTLQNITNALNNTISHFERMQQVSGNSIDTTSLNAAREEIRQAEANIVALQEAMTEISRTGQQASQSMLDIGRIASSVSESIAPIAGMIEQQTTAILRMADVINHTLQRTEDNTRQPVPQEQHIGLLQRGYQAVANRVKNVVQQNERLNQIVQRTVGENTRLGHAIRTAGHFAMSFTNSVRGVVSHIRSAIREQDIFNQILANGSVVANTLLENLKGIAGKYLSFEGINFLGKLSDNVTSILSRLDLMNDGLQTTKELSDKIMRSSFDAGADYLTTAESIAKMGLNAGSAFASNDELIAFMDQINKTFAIGGATAEEQNNAMLQLTQAMAAGALRGEELNSILDSGPGIARNIERYMGWAEGSIKSYAEEGEISAQIVKNAMLSMAQETNEKFNSMPATIGQTFSRIKTLAIKAFTPILQGINGLFNHQNATSILYQVGAVFQYLADRASATIEKLKNIVNSDEFLAFSSDIMTAFSAVGAVITWVLDTIVNAFDYVINHWEEVKPVLTGIAVALGVVTAAQWALNIAMSLNPVTFVIAGIMALIALLYKVVDHINKVKNTSISATGMIAGVFAGMYAVVKNVVAAVWNTVAILINFIYNFSQNKVAALKVLFLEWSEGVLAQVQTIIQALRSLTDHIPDIPIVTSGIEKVDDWLTKARNHAKDMAQTIKTEAGFEDLMPKMDFEDVNQTVEDVYNKIARFAEGFQEYMEDFDPFSGIQTTNDLLADVLKNVETTAKNTDKIEEKLERSKEDLEFLRTVANIKYGDKYIMPQVKVEMTNNNTIQKEMDLDGFFDRKVEEIGHLISMSAEGVHI